MESHYFPQVGSVAFSCSKYNDGLISQIEWGFLNETLNNYLYVVINSKIQFSFFFVVNGLDMSGHKEAEESRGGICRWKN